MQTSVKLQDPFTYSIIPIVVIIIICIIYVIWIILKYKPKKAKKISERIVKTIDVGKIKNRYLKKLNEVELKLNNNKISTRTAYQHTSKIIRGFVQEVTKIKVQNYTLEEIKHLNIPKLYELVEEYYEPEFARRSEGDIKKSIDKTRKVIEKWS